MLFEFIVESSPPILCEVVFFFSNGPCLLLFLDPDDSPCVLTLEPFLPFLAPFELNFCCCYYYKANFYLLFWDSIFRLKRVGLPCWTKVSFFVVVLPETWPLVWGVLMFLPLELLFLMLTMSNAFKLVLLSIFDLVVILLGVMSRASEERWLEPAEWSL